MSDDGGVLHPEVFEDVDNRMIWDLHVRGGQPVVTVAQHLEMSVAKVYERLSSMTVAAVPAAEVRLYRDMEWARSEELLNLLWRDVRSADVTAKQRATTATAILRVMSYRAELKGLSEPRVHRVEIDTTKALHQEYAQLCEALGVDRLDDADVIDV